MRLLVDQNVKDLPAESLQEAGHDPVHVSVYNMQKAKDAEILNRAVIEDRIVVTKDRDFSILLASSKALKPSVISLRLPSSDWRPDKQIDILLHILATYQSELTRGAIISAKHRMDIRVRLLPLE